MHKTVQNLIDIQKEINSNLNNLELSKVPKIIAVSKTFTIDKINPLIEHGHLDFGENKVQEAVDKWTEVKEKFQNLKLHMIGKLQTNKVKYVIPLFDYIHSLDNLKLAEKISQEQKKNNKSLKIFIQVNIGNESQKSGVLMKDVKSFLKYCSVENKLNIIGLMVLPPNDTNTEKYFEDISKLNSELGLKDLSMGMSTDYKIAAKHKSTYLRIGSAILGPRT